MARDYLLMMRHFIYGARLIENQLLFGYETLAILDEIAIK